jgi:hypothetical protein
MLPGSGAVSPKDAPAPSEPPTFSSATLACFVAEITPRNLDVWFNILTLFLQENAVAIQK